MAILTNSEIRERALRLWQYLEGEHSDTEELALLVFALADNRIECRPETIHHEEPITTEDESADMLSALESARNALKHWQ